jgi:hypothetical protein
MRKRIRYHFALNLSLAYWQVLICANRGIRRCPKGGGHSKIANIHCVRTSLTVGTATALRQVTPAQRVAQGIAESAETGEEVPESRQTIAFAANSDGFGTRIEHDARVAFLYTRNLRNVRTSMRPRRATAKANARVKKSLC